MNTGPSAQPTCSTHTVTLYTSSPDFLEVVNIGGDKLMAQPVRTSWMCTRLKSLSLVEGSKNTVDSGPSWMQLQKNPTRWFRVSVCCCSYQVLWADSLWTWRLLKTELNNHELSFVVWLIFEPLLIQSHWLYSPNLTRLNSRSLWSFWLLQIIGQNRAACQRRSYRSCAFIAGRFIQTGLSEGDGTIEAAART